MFWTSVLCCRWATSWRKAYASAASDGSVPFVGNGMGREAAAFPEHAIHLGGCLQPS